MKGCPICKRRSWFTDEAVADHVDDQHAVAARTPCGKVRYRTDAQALDALILTKRRPSEKRREHRRYQCGRCGGWHLTSRPEAVA